MLGDCEIAFRPFTIDSSFVSVSMHDSRQLSSLAYFVPVNNNFALEKFVVGVFARATG